MQSVAVKYHNAIKCCKECLECPHCYDITQDRIYDVLYAIDTTLSKNSEKELCHGMWGFSKPSMPTEISRKLVANRDVLFRYYYTVNKNINTCLCPEEIQSVLEDSLNFVDMGCVFDRNRCDVNVDTSNKSLWELTHKGCVPMEVWEEKVNWVIPEIGFEVSNVTDIYTLFSEISVENVSDMCAILATLSVVTKAIQEDRYDFLIDKVKCDVGYEFVVKDIDACRIEYNTLIKKVGCNTRLKPEVRKVLCGLEFDTFVKLLECNISVGAITKLMECGLQVTYSAKNRCAEIKVGTSSVLLDAGFDVSLLGDDVDLSVLEGLAGASCNTDIPLDLNSLGYNLE